MTEHSKIDLQVMWNRLLSIADEQSMTILRTAFNTTLREGEDISAAIFDIRGRMLVQAAIGSPGHVNPMAEGVAQFLAEYPSETMRPGDVYITNDPWIGTGHLHDVFIVTPVFLDNKILALTASTGHVADIGGVGLGPHGREIFEEGLQIPVMRIMQNGEPNGDLVKLIRLNVREPDVVIGDIMAMIVGNDDASKRLCEMAREFGLRSLDQLAEYIFEASHSAVVKRIADLPKGTWTGSTICDGYDFPVKIQATITIHERGIHVDFAGTAEPSKYGINSVLNYTKAYVLYILKCIVISDEIPNNTGTLAPFTVSAPDHCILNAKRPAPVAARHLTALMVPDAIMACFHDAVPGLVPAESSGTLWGTLLRGGPHAVGSTIKNDPEVSAPFNYYHFNQGGTGARPSKDGLSATGFPSCVKTQPVESAEVAAPIVFWRRELRPDSGGAGRFRGGLGQIIEIGGANGYKIVNASMFDRIDHPASGRGGGHNGSAGRISMSSGEIPHAKGQLIIGAHQRLILHVPGGGGYGDPRTRDRSALIEDIRDGYVSVEAAETEYGVLIGEVEL